MHSRQSYRPQQQSEPVYRSTMSAQQKYLQVVQSVKNSLGHNNNSAKVRGCAIHVQPSKKCRKCKEILDGTQLNKDNEQNHTQWNLSIELPTVLKLSCQNPMSCFSEKLQSSIQGNIVSNNSKEEPRTVKQLVHCVPRQEISIDCYVKGTQVTTPFIILFYRLTRMRPTYQQMMIMLRSNNVNVKALAMLYIRMFGAFEDIFAWLKSKFEDFDLINAQMTISEFAIRLLDDEKSNYDGLRLPRIPVKIQRAINAHIGKSYIDADALRKQQACQIVQKKIEEAQIIQNSIKTDPELQIQQRNTIERSKQKQKSRSRSRQKVRQKKKKRQSSPSSSSSSSSSLSSLSRQRRQKRERRHKKQEEKEKEKWLNTNAVQTHKTNNTNKVEASRAIQKEQLSLAALKQKIKGIDAASNRKQQIIEKYGQVDNLDQEEEEPHESDSQQKYQMG